jgi:hypothetical protein
MVIWIISHCDMENISSHFSIFFYIKFIMEDYFNNNKEKIFINIKKKSLFFSGSAGTIIGNRQDSKIIFFKWIFLKLLLSLEIEIWPIFDFQGLLGGFFAGVFVEFQIVWGFKSTRKSKIFWKLIELRHIR